MAYKSNKGFVFNYLEKVEKKHISNSQIVIYHPRWVFNYFYSNWTLWELRGL